MKNTKIISAFPACGKTYLFNKYKNYSSIKFMDSDSSEFHWVYDKDNKKTLNPNWPINYIEHIKENIGKADIIFVSSHDEIRDLLFDNNIEYTLVVPYDRITCMYEWVGRMYCRNNKPEFINNIINNWNKWLCDISNKINYNDIIYLTESEYLDDIISINFDNENNIIKLIKH